MTTSRLVGVVAAALSSAVVASAAAADSDDSPAAEMLPTGQRITPEAATGAHFQDLDPGLAAYPAHRAGMAVSTIASHDGKTLLILTSGFNKMWLPNGKTDPAASNEYVFVFDIANRTPRQVQVLQVPNTDGGIALRRTMHISTSRAASTICCTSSRATTACGPRMARA